MTHLWKKKTQEVHKRDKWCSYRKFILEGDEVNSNNEPDEKGDEIREWITTVIHDLKIDKLMEDGRNNNTDESASKRDKMSRTLWQE